MSPTPSQPPSLDSTVVAEIASRIEKMMTENQIPGFAIGIVQAGQVSYAAGFGTTEIDGGQAVTPATLFDMASVSKCFTAIAILQLVEQKKIDLDTRVIEVLPYFQLEDDRYIDITVRHLLSHTSGLPLDPAEIFPQWKIYDDENPDDDDEALERFVRSLSALPLLTGPTSATFHYSNIGYDILGDVIAKVSGQIYEEYMRQKVFILLGMEGSTLLLDEADGALLARGHELGVESGKLGTHSSFPFNRAHSPSGGLISCVNDLNQAALTLLNGGERNGTCVVNSESLAAMWLPVTHPNGGDLLQSYGLGWVLAELEGHHFAWHPGGGTGFKTNFNLATRDGMAVTTLCNSCGYGDERSRYASEVGNGVMKYLLGLEE